MRMHLKVLWLDKVEAIDRIIQIKIYLKIL